MKKFPEHTLNDPNFSVILHKLNSNDPIISKLYCQNDEKVLFFRKPKTNMVLLCCPESLENKVIRLAHEFLGHLGTNKVYNYLKYFVIFPKLRVKVHHFVRSCLACQQSKPMNVKLHPNPVPVLAAAPFDQLSVDLYGPLPRAFGSCQYILVVLDVCSKFIKFIPIQKATAVVVTRNFLQKYVEKIGKPKMVVADRGPCFRSKYWDTSLKALDINPRHSSVYHPQSNPVERYMRILGDFFRIYCHENHKSWVHYVSFLEQCLNNSVSDSTKFTPVEIMLDTPPTNFLQNFVSFPPFSENLSHPEKLVLVQENLRKSALRRERKQGPQSANLGFKQGDEILLKSHHLSNALGIWRD